MKITADTNILVRAITEDDPRQSHIAQYELANATLVALPLPALCELVWVLSRGRGWPVAKVAEALRGLINSATVAVNRPAAEAGLRMLDMGGDFADGVIAFEGAWLGADCFASFDKEAVKRLAAQGRPVRLLS